MKTPLDCRTAMILQNLTKLDTCRRIVKLNLRVSLNLCLGHLIGSAIYGQVWTSWQRQPEYWLKYLVKFTMPSIFTWISRPQSSLYATVFYSSDPQYANTKCILLQTFYLYQILEWKKKHFCNLCTLLLFPPIMKPESGSMPTNITDRWLV